MAETVLHGLIIDCVDFNVYDQIIKILLPSNLIKSFLALGVNKILSKNARHISLLNEVEVEAFLARSNSSLSKLKKVIALVRFDYHHLLNKVVQVYLHYVNLFQVELKQDFFNYFIYLREKIIKKTFVYEVDLSALLRLIFYDLGLSFYLENCIVCQNCHIQTLSLKEMGLICQNCNDGHEKIYPSWFLKNFYFFMLNNPNKIIFNKAIEQKFFYQEVISILNSLIKQNAGINLLNEQKVEKKK